MTHITPQEKSIQTDNTIAQPKPRPSLLVNAASNWVVLVLNTLVSLVLAPLIIAHIGKAGFGIWTLTISFIGYFGLLRLGVGTAIMRFIPYYDGRGEKRSLDGTFSTAMAIYIAVGIVILIISFTACHAISDFFGQGEQFALMLRIIGAAAALSCPCAVFDAVIRAREKFVAANLITATIALAKGATLALCLWLGYRLITMTLVMVVLSALCLLLDIIVFVKVCPDISFSARLIKISHFKHLLSLGVLATITSLGFVLRFQSERIIVGKFMGMEYLGIFAIGSALMGHFRNTVGSATRVLRPRFGYLDGSGNYKRSVSLFLAGTEFAALVACVLALLLMTAGPAFIRLWVGEGFQQVYPVVLILAAGYMIGQSQTSCISMIGGYGKQGLLAVLALSEGTANIALAVVFVPRLGMIGMALAIVLPMVIFQGIIQPLCACRILGLNVVKYFARCLIRPWALVGLMFFVVRTADLSSLASTWPSFIAFALITAATFAAISYVFVLGPQQRSTVIGIIARLRFPAAAP